jgi:hypothetical protein
MMMEVEIPTINEAKSTAEKLTDHVSEYVQTYLELTSVKATQKAADIATFGFTATMISFFGMIISVFLGLGLAEFFSESMSGKEGYFLVTLIYAVIGAIVIGFRKQLIFPFLRDKIATTIYENKD